MAGAGIALTDSVLTRVTLTDSALTTVTLEDALVMAIAGTGTMPFAQYPAGMRSRHGRLEELETFVLESGVPVGQKPIVVAESRGKAGVLTYLWLVLQAQNPGPMESTGRVRIYIDDPATPVIDMQVNDFFCCADNGGVFSTPRVARTERSSYGGAPYNAGHERTLWMPYQKYLRVEYRNADPTYTVTCYGQAHYYDLATPFTGLLRDYRILGSRQASMAFPAPLTVCDVAGSGQVESLWVSGNYPSGNPSWLEGNTEIYIDGESTPSFLTTGTEDTFGGGFYQVPVGAYPRGACGAAAGLGGGQSSLTWYRFFLDDPITFSTHLKIVQNIGQLGESTSGTMNSVAAYAGLWFSTPRTVQSYPLAGPGLSTLLYSAPIAGYTTGALPAPWTVNSDGNGTWQQNSGAISSTDATKSGRYGIIPRSSVGITTDDYRIEATVRIDGATANAEVMIAGRQNGTSTFAASEGMSFKRANQYQWQVHLRGTNAITQAVFHVENGHDLLGVPVMLALEVQGATLRGYWKMPLDAVWQPLGSCVTTHASGDLAVWTYIAAASVLTFDVFAIGSGS